MIWLTSPQPQAVLQRDERDSATVSIDLTTDARNGTAVEARAVPPKTSAGDVAWTTVGEVRRGRLTGGTLGPLATGGPYEIQVRIGDEVADAAGVLVGDVFLLAGQSNMDGCGKLTGVEAPSRLVHCFYYDDRWDVARDPLCRYNEAVDPVHWGVAEEELEAAAQHDRDFRLFGAGLGVRFGKEILRRHGVPVGLLACSHGGTSLDQWSPKKLGEGGHSLYGSMVRRVRAAGGKVRACLWYQGESDAATPDGLEYRRNLVAFIRALRRQLKAPDLPFLQVQIACFFGDASVFPHWNGVQVDQLLVEDDLPAVATVAAVDLPMADAIHVSTDGMKTLAVRLAHLADILVYGDASKEVGPRFASATVAEDRRSVEVTLAGVNGKLRAARPLRGFTITAGEAQVPIAQAKLSGPASVTLGLREPLAEGAVLWYGAGHNPAVSLSDAAGLPVPVSGPMDLQ